MLQYIINCSAIWLLSLLCYEVFLRRTTFHQYNRFYLLGTLLAGILIPMISIENGTSIYQTASNYHFIEQTIINKQNITHAVSQYEPSKDSVSISWIPVLYFAGCLIAFLFAIVDLSKTIKLYRKGKRKLLNGFKIIETQKEHGPFSFLGSIFISSTNAYNEAELNMILKHEHKHNTLLHSLDLILIESIKIAFWFHPLAYLYRNRLLMLHEYQADSNIGNSVAVYGKFLLANTFSSRTPIIAHSFNYSPLKNRILMLTRKSSTWSKSKMLIAVPVMAVAFMYCTKNVATDTKRVVDGNKVTYKGNTFEMFTPPVDTFLWQDPKTGKWDTASITALPSPIKMNGVQLITGKVDKMPELKEADENKLVYGVFVKNKTILEKLDDGEYRINVNNTVVGKKGEVLYFDWEGITNAKFDEQKKAYAPVTPQNVKSEFDASLEQFVDKLQFNPALLGGQPVLYVNGLLMPIRLKVKNHQANVIDDAGISQNIKSLEE